MYTVGADFYYGSPQIIWDNLIEKAEDLFSEEEIGTHILGIYPAGNRIYGCESQSEGLLCLYMDTIDNIIDPCIGRLSKSYTVNNQNNKIWFVELREYILWLIKDVYGLNKKLVRTEWQDNCFHLLPSNFDSFAEDTSINNIMYYISELNILEEESYYIPNSYINNDKKYALLSARARILWRERKTFIPNINQEWDIIDLFDSEIDNKFINMICKNEIDSQIISDYSAFLTKRSYTNKVNKYKQPNLGCKLLDQIEKSNKIKQELRKEVIKLYRSLC